MGIAAVAPNAMQMFNPTRSKKRFSYQTKTVLGQLKERGLVTFEQKRDKSYARITAKGKQELLHSAAFHQRRKPWRWDGRYRIVIFDIPERRRDVRDRLRQKMQGFGFMRLQDSVLVYPYDCEDFIALLKADLRIGKDVLYLIVEKMEGDTKVRKHFGL